MKKKSKDHYWIFAIVIVVFIAMVAVLVKYTPMEVEIAEDEALVGEALRSVEYFLLEDYVRYQPKEYYVGESDPIIIYAEKIERDKKGALRAYVHVTTKTVDKTIISYGDVYEKDVELINIAPRKNIEITLKQVFEDKVHVKIKVPIQRKR